MLDNETALINGSQERADENSACVGVTSDATPEVESQPKSEDLQSGGSVENILSATAQHELTIGEQMFPKDKTKQWFVLRIILNKMEDARKAFKNELYYYPMRKESRWEKKVGSTPKQIITEKPLIKDLLFVYAKGDSLRNFLKSNPQLSYITYRYDHCVTNEFGKNPPMTIGYKVMINFINATSTDEEDVQMVDHIEKIHFKSGDKVKVTGGKFKNVEGWVIRLGKQQRVLVRLNNFLNFATSYIPNHFISPLNEKSEEQL